ncbi:GGDEF domain-containing protein [Dactylosporangium sp. NPDC005572]|uniref:GGDEF domain-containing protein n=1 Tax=Dactylosporangium sp. NPDC005572 TaxID=3156889 RepID=UPI0033AAF582
MLTAAGGVLAGAAVMTVPLLRLRRAVRLARYQAGHDDTTGLPNRRTLLTALRRAVIDGPPFGLILLDLDGFKTVNDTHGHEAGNDLLTVVGQRLTDLPDPVWLAARLSGDEFAVLVNGGPDEVGTTAHLAAAMIESEPVTVDGGGQLAIRVSVGYTTGRPGITARTLLREADEAMYHAKTYAIGVSRYRPTGAATVGPLNGDRPTHRCRDRR